MRCATHLKAAFPGRKLVDISADAIEDFLRNRLRQRVRVKVARGYREKGILKSTTVYQEFRVLRRMLNVAVRKKLLAANPCSGVEFPVAVKGLFRPHYVIWSEQERIESNGPDYLKNAVQIITETGVRVYKELTPMKKDQVDLPNAVVWILGLQDSERYRRGPSHTTGCRSISAADGDLRRQSLFVPQRSQSERAPNNVQDGLA